MYWAQQPLCEYESLLRLSTLRCFYILKNKYKCSSPYYYVRFVIWCMIHAIIYPSYGHGVCQKRILLASLISSESYIWGWSEKQ